MDKCLEFVDIIAKCNKEEPASHLSPTLVRLLSALEPDNKWTSVVVDTSPRRLHAVRGTLCLRLISK
jgi:hypothetical protein